MELITGSPDAAVWRQDQPGGECHDALRAWARRKAFGSIESDWGSFGTWRRRALGFGTPKFGNFIALNGIRSGRFLDTPEFLPIHDIGNNETIFDRFD